MTFEEYQREASKTDAVTEGDASEVIPLLGLSGEVGELVSEYKKFLREGDSFKLFKEKLTEELGDILWYLSSFASKRGISLEEIAMNNLAKTRRRWPGDSSSQKLLFVRSFDAGFPVGEQIPRRMEVELRPVSGEGTGGAETFVNGVKVGDSLTDNSYVEDGYRFHDVIHFGFAGILGWSPVVRSIVRVKRKSSKQTDEVEDGGRAIVLEEGISALIFSNAARHDFYESTTSLDYKLLRTIVDMTSEVEVGVCTEGDWERAILSSYDVWREIVKNNGGTFIVELDAQSISLK
jgi:NTP pyrophosphatase (non-canonical NTP hydrolase)